MKIKKYRSIALVAKVTILCLTLSSCNIIQNIVGSKDDGQSNSQYQAIKWKDIREKFNKPSAEDLNKIIAVSDDGNLLENQNELDEIYALFEKVTNPEIKLSLLMILSTNNLPGQEEKLKNLLKEIAKSDDKRLSPVALSELVNAEWSRDSAGKDQWETWRWSDDVKILLEEASNKSMYKLSRISATGLGPLMLLSLAKKYPNSEFTKGAKEYRSFIGQEPYFGSYLDLPDGKIRPKLRQPFNPQREISF
jgi:hypothetical protein